MHGLKNGIILSSYFLLIKCTSVSHHCVCITVETLSGREKASDEVNQAEFWQSVEAHLISGRLTCNYISCISYICESLLVNFIRIFSLPAIIFQYNNWAFFLISILQLSLRHKLLLHTITGLLFLGNVGVGIWLLTLNMRKLE